MKINRLLSLLFISLCAITLHAQESNKAITAAYSERIHLHVNSGFLLTGESLLFNVYCQNTKDKTPSQLSDVAYVELVDEKGSPVLSSKVFLKNGKGNGDFFLSSTLITGNYTLVAYTRWMKNYSSATFFSESIAIINPFRKPETSKKSDLIVTQKVVSAELITTNSKLEIIPAGKNLNAREKASLTLKLNDASSATVSVSVHKIEQEESRLKNINSIYTESANQSSSVRYLPDFRGNLISGSVKRKSQNALPTDAILYLSIPSKDYQFYAAKIDSLGRFYVNTKVTPVSDLVLQVGGIPASDVEVNLDNDFLVDYKNFTPSPIRIDSAWRKIIEKRSVYSQIENAYYVTKHDSSLWQKNDRFYYRADKVYKLDQFTRFPTMEDVLREYVAEVYVKKKDESFILKAMNGKFTLPFVEDPLLLLDGIPVFDPAIIMNYDPLLIERIDIVTKKFFYGPTSWGGVVSFETYDGVAKNMNLSNAIKVKYSGIQPQKLYYSPDYENHKAKLSRIPDYRTQLYWNPDLKLQPNSSSEINFFASDVAGDFLITVEGFLANGEPLHIEQVIPVKDSERD